MSTTDILHRKEHRSPRLETGIALAQNYLFAIQNDDGHWVGELEGDTILESEYILALVFAGLTGDPRLRKAAEYIRRQQMPDSAWSIYPGGPPEISASAKAYFVLKLMGDSPDAPHMVRARKTILDLGGLDACNSFTKIYLAVFGQYPWEKCPAVPPELVLLPRWSPVNLYEMSSWSRGIVVPLSLVRTLRARCDVPARAAIPELVRSGWRPARRSALSDLFNGLDAALKLTGRLPVPILRETALRKAEEWILERLEGSDGIGAIFPPIVNTIMALSALGYPTSHPVIRGQLRELAKLEIEEGDTLRVQPCFSPTWDTALAANALAESGVPTSDPRLARAAEWLMTKRGHDRGDWKAKNHYPGRTGWFFEYANPFYPDCDTTSQAVIALSRLHPPDPGLAARCRQALFEGMHWHLSMQCRNGGWGAFDRDCDLELLTHVPFADHNAMIDPPTADLTARALEMLACVGYDASYVPARKAIEFLLAEQEPDGSWYGRWGCNYLYGTWLALWGLRAIGEDTVSSPWARRAADWIASVQNDDGGWGELPDSYEDASRKGQGPSTAAQTAWAVMGLMAAGRRDTRAVHDGIEFLLDTQRSDGSWIDEPWTGTGFPRVFYLRYHLYAVYFPLLALGEYRRDGHPRERRPRPASRASFVPSARAARPARHEDPGHTPHPRPES